jgi:hypothetical protein
MQADTGGHIVFNLQPSSELPDFPERRSADRFPIQREVRFKILSKRTAGEPEEGVGTTINISSNGVLFTTDQVLAPGRRLELAISWPAELDNRCQLKLIARGRVARQEQGQAAVEIQQYEFRTAGRKASTSDATPPPSTKPASSSYGLGGRS